MMQNTSFFIPKNISSKCIAAVFSGATMYYVDQHNVYRHGNTRPIYETPAFVVILSAISALGDSYRNCRTIKLRLSNGADHYVELDETKADHESEAEFRTRVHIHGVWRTDDPYFNTIIACKENPQSKVPVDAFFSDNRIFLYHRAKGSRLVVCGSNALAMITTERFLVVNVYTQATAGVGVDLEPGFVAEYNPKTSEFHFFEPSGAVKTMPFGRFSDYLSLLDIYSTAPKNPMDFRFRFQHGDRCSRMIGETADKMKEGDFCRLGETPYNPYFNLLPKPVAEEDIEDDDEQESAYSTSSTSSTASYVEYLWSPPQKPKRAINKAKLPRKLLIKLSKEEPTVPKRIRLVSFSSSKVSN